MGLVTNKQRLVTRSKQQAFPMEVIFSRFSHLTEQIFDNLDNVCLTNCTQVSRRWQSYLENKRFLGIRMIKSKMASAKDGKVGKPWEKFFKASNSKTVNYIANSVMELCNKEFAVESMDNYIEYAKLRTNFYFAKFDESLAPLHIPAIQGKLTVFKYIFDISKNKEPKNSDGYTPLHWAAFYGHLNTCIFLMTKSIDKKSRNFYW